jgi:hypothetical protein
VIVSGMLSVIVFAFGILCVIMIVIRMIVLALGVVMPSVRIFGVL